MATIPQPSLSGGEMAPSLHGRVDIARYQTSLKTCLNFVSQAYGGVKNRAGSRYIAAAHTSGTTSRLVPFSFSSTQSYVLEIVGGAGTDGYMRIFSQGALVVYTAEEVARQTLAGISPLPVAGNPVTLRVPWQIGDVRDLTFSQSGDVLTVTHQNYEPRQVARYGSAHWELRTLPRVDGPWGEQNFNKGEVVVANATTGTVTLSSNIKGTFLGKAGVMFQMSQIDRGKSWEPGAFTILGDIRYSDGKYYQAVRFEGVDATTGNIRPSHPEGKASDGKVEWQFLHNGTGWCTILETSLDGQTATAIVPSGGTLPHGVAGSTAVVGTPIYFNAMAASPVIQSNGEAAVRLTTANSSYVTTAHGLPLNTVIQVDMIFTLNGQSENSYPNLTATAQTSTTIDIVKSSLLWFVSTGLNLNGRNFITPVVGRSGDLVGATPNWAFGAWGGSERYPACSAYFQQRHCFAGSYGHPQTVWMSKTGNYSDFGVSSPILDDDSVTFTVASSAIDGIRSMLTMDKLALFTMGGNWVTSGGQSDAVTPGDVVAKLQNYYGSSNLAPLGVGNAALYYGKSGTIRDMSYEFAADSYVGNDLTVMANHLLVDKTILEWTFQQAPFPIVWMVRSDGVLLGMTYLREEKVVGWHRHDLTGTVESVCVVNECGEDHLYLEVKRTINGSTVRYIECIYPRVDDEYEACFVDAASTYDGRNTTSTTVTITGTYTAGGTVTITASAAIFTAGVSEAGDEIVLESPAGTYFRLLLGSGTAGTTVRTATVGAVALPAALQSTALSTWAFARRTFTGLTHLANTAVSVLAEGTYATGTVSAGGVLTLANCTPVLGPAFVMTVGLPITAGLEPLRVTVPGPQGPLLGEKKLISTVQLLVENSRSFYISNNSAGTFYEATVKTAEDLFTSVTQGTGVVEVNLASTWNTNGSFYLKHTKPYPLSITALLPNVEVGG